MGELLATIRGEMVRPLPKANRTYGKHRTCGQEDCVTTLSSYNRGPLCWVHRMTAERFAVQPLGPIPAR